MVLVFLDDYVISSNPSGGQLVEIIRRSPSNWEIYVISKEIDESILGRVNCVTVKLSDDLSKEEVRRAYISSIPSPTIDIFHCNSLSHSFNLDYRIKKRVTTVHSAALGRLVAIFKSPIMYYGKNIKLHIIYNLGFAARLCIYLLREIIDVIKLRRLKINFVSVSQGLSKELRLYGLIVGEIINNAVDSPDQAHTAGIHSKSSELRIVNVGDLNHPHKTSVFNSSLISDHNGKHAARLLCVSHGKWGSKGVFKLLKIVKKYDLDVEIHVVGHSRIDDLLDYSSELGISEKLTIHGEIKDKNRIYSIAPILINLSWYESFGLVSAEANNWGIYVISSPTHGVKQWLNDLNNGVICYGSDEEIADAIRYAISRQHQVVSVCKDKYSAYAMVNGYLKLYEKDR